LRSGPDPVDGRLPGILDVASWASFYQDQISRPWPEVVQDVRQDVQAVIDREGAFVVSGDLAAFVCR
jgi:hypothetical protein